MRIALVIPVLALALNGQSPGYLISTVAGSGWIGDGGPATQAILRQPGGVAADANGNIYIAETGGHRVRKVDRSGAITTLAGTGVAGFSGDGGPAAQAQLASPYGVAADILGNVYIADLGNARVRRVGLDGNIMTVAGGGTLDPGPANEGMPRRIDASADAAQSSGGRQRQSIHFRFRRSSRIQTFGRRSAHYSCGHGRARICWRWGPGRCGATRISGGLGDGVRRIAVYCRQCKPRGAPDFEWRHRNVRFGGNAGGAGAGCPCNLICGRC